MFNDRKMKNREYSRREYFEANERATLNPLPDSEFTLKYTKTRTVGSNYHVYIDTHQYSVPHEYVNKIVSVVYDKETVEIYDMQFNRIALHKRSFKRYGYTTIQEHMPPNHLAYEYQKGSKNAAYYLFRASKCGPAVEEVIRMILRKSLCVQQAYKSCEAVLQLQKEDYEGFLRACEYAVENLETANHRIIHTIMTNKTYLKKKLKEEADEQFIHSNLRGPKAYNQ